MVKQFPISPESSTKVGFDEISDKGVKKRTQWTFSRSSLGWRHRFATINVANNVRNVAASCTMILNSFVLGIGCIMIYNVSWGCSQFSSCPAKCSFLIGLGVQCVILLSLSMTLFLSSAYQFPVSSPLSYLPSMLGAMTIITYHWVLYGTYAKIITNVCQSSRLEYAFSIVLVLGHVLLGMPSLITALIWKFGRHSTFEEQNLCQADDESAAPTHETNSLLKHQLNDHESC